MPRPSPRSRASAVDGAASWRCCSPGRAPCRNPTCVPRLRRPPGLCRGALRRWPARRPSWRPSPSPARRFAGDAARRGRLRSHPRPRWAWSCRANRACSRQTPGCAGAGWANLPTSVVVVVRPLCLAGIGGRSSARRGLVRVEEWLGDLLVFESGALAARIATRRLAARLPYREGTGPNARDRAGLCPPSGKGSGDGGGSPHPPPNRALPDRAAAGVVGR